MITAASEKDVAELDAWLREADRTGEYPSSTPRLFKKRTAAFF